MDYIKDTCYMFYFIDDYNNIFFVRISAKDLRRIETTFIKKKIILHS